MQQSRQQLVQTNNQLLLVHLEGLDGKVAQLALTCLHIFCATGKERCTFLRFENRIHQLGLEIELCRGRAIIVHGHDFIGLNLLEENCSEG